MVKFKALEKKLISKIADLRAIAWKVRNSKNIKKVFIKNKQLKQKITQDRKSTWKLLEVVASEKFVAQKAVDELKLKTEELKKMAEDLEELSSKNRMLVKVRFDLSLRPSRDQEGAY